MATNQSAETGHDVLVAIENAGERMVPEVTGAPTFWEHVYRYAFACRFAKDKRVLDVACGEGYGAAALRKAGAAPVIGVDVSEAACSHARERYRLDARVGRAEKIPLPDRSVDVVVSFETIEHVLEPLRFLDECARVLVPRGRLVISTPNKEVYSAPGQPKNPHHCSEMTEGEFVSALGKRFRDVKLYSQHPRWAPWWSIRTLAADETPWNRLQLFQRLHRSARFRLVPIAVCGPSAEQRNTVIEQILATRRPGPLAPLNPYVLRTRRLRAAEQPFYFIATATSREQL